MLFVMTPPLHDAAQRGDTETCRLLLDAAPGAATALDQRQRTPLHWAAWRGHTEICRMLLDVVIRRLPTLTIREREEVVSLLDEHSKEMLRTTLSCVWPALRRRAIPAECILAIACAGVVDRLT